MQEDILVLTQKDRDRLKVLHEVRKGHITQRQGAEQLKLTDRWIREMMARIRERGDKAVIHGLRGQPSARKIDGKVEQRAVQLVEQEYTDFGPTLALEHLQKDPMHMMTEIHRVLKANGTLVLTTPNAVSLRALRAVIIE